MQNTLYLEHFTICSQISSLSMFEFVKNHALDGMWVFCPTTEPHIPSK